MSALINVAIPVFDIVALGYMAGAFCPASMGYSILH